MLLHIDQVLSAHPLNMVLYDGDHGFLSVKLRDCQFFSGTQFVPTGLHWYPLWLFTWSFGYSSTTSDGSPYEKRVDARGHVLSDKSIADEVPFEELPEGWAWARLEDCCNIIVDCPHSTPNYLAVETGYSAIDTNCMDDDWRLTGLRSLSQESYEKRTARYAPQVGDIVFSREGSIGRSVILREGNICLGQRVMLLSCNETLLFNRYCQAVLSSPYAWTLYRAANVGTGVKHINVSMIKTLLIPVPPLAEQRRIVGRANELMPLVEKYGRLEDAREELDTALPGRLRKSVLQMAVQGKLVSQDLTDEPACKLLKRIRDQRHELVAEKKMKAPKGGESVIFRGSDGRRYEKRVDAKGRESEPVCIEDEIPFEIPEGWEWARLESVCSLIRGSGIKRADVMADGLPCVRYGELYTTYETSIVDVASLTSKEIFDVSKKLEPDEVLVTLTGENDIDIGRAVYNASGSVLAFGGDLLALKGRKVRGDYLAMAINSSAVGSQRTKASTGNIIVHLSAAKVSRFLVPLPPLAEQACIVEQFETLLSIIA